jgi:two-component system response regulator
MTSTSPHDPDVVIVEDNEDDARMTTMALRGIEPRPSVTVLVDGAKALEHLLGEDRLRPQLVLLDLKLPKVHGLDVLAALKGDVDCHDLPVLVLTSSDEPSDVKRAQTLGCQGYLCKPVDWKEYLKLVCSEAADYLKDSTCTDGA